MRSIPAIATIATLGMAGVSLLRPVGWVYPFELLSHFQSQYLIAALIALAGLLLARRFRLAAVTAVATVVIAVPVVPYLPGPDRWNEVHAEPTPMETGERPVRVLLTNLLYGNTDHASIARMIRDADADLVVLQEANNRHMAALAGIVDAYPFQVLDPRADAFGMCVLSRLPVSDVEVPVSGLSKRPSFVLTVDVDGLPVTVVCTHPRQPLHPDLFRQRNDQLVQVADIAAPRQRPLVLVGDLNTTMWSPWFSRLAGDSGLRSARLGHGVNATWPAQLPAPMRIPIDHVLVSEGVTVRSFELGPRVGSDHLPVVVDLVF